jgi:hypothetical protein
MANNRPQQLLEGMSSPGTYHGDNVRFGDYPDNAVLPIDNRETTDIFFRQELYGKADVVKLVDGEHIPRHRVPDMHSGSTTRLRMSAGRGEDPLQVISRKRYVQLQTLDCGSHILIANFPLRALQIIRIHSPHLYL